MFNKKVVISLKKNFAAALSGSAKHQVISGADNVIHLKNALDIWKRWERTSFLSI